MLDDAIADEDADKEKSIIKRLPAPSGLEKLGVSHFGSRGYGSVKYRERVKKERDYQHGQTSYRKL